MQYVCRFTYWHASDRYLCIVLVTTSRSQEHSLPCKPMLAHTDAHRTSARAVHSQLRSRGVQVFCENQFDILTELLPYVPFDRPVHVLDAGANIGLASLALTAFMRHHGSITAVEAYPPTFAQLRRNVAPDGIVTPVLAALVPEAEAGANVTFGNAQPGVLWGAHTHSRVVSAAASWLSQIGGKAVSSVQRATDAAAPLLEAADDEALAALPGDSESVFQVRTVSLRQLAVRFLQQRRLGVRATQL